MSDELVRIGEVHYSKPMARALLRDVRLSFGARGLFAFLWDLPKGWKPNLAHLVTMNPKGREAVLLRQAGNSAAPGGPTQKRRRRRSTGIVTWTADDEAEAQRIELAYSSELVAAGIESAKKDGRQPLPGIVEEYIQRLIEAKAGSGRQTELRARIVQDMQDRIEASADIVANGEKLLSSVRSGRRAHDAHE